MIAILVAFVTWVMLDALRQMRQINTTAATKTVERGTQSELNLVDQITIPTNVYCSPGGECYHTSRKCEGLQNVPMNAIRRWRSCIHGKNNSLPQSGRGAGCLSCWKQGLFELTLFKVQQCGWVIMSKLLRTSPQKILSQRRMDILPLSFMNKEQRQSQYLANKENQENQERKGRNELSLDPGALDISNMWNAKRVNNHEKLSPFCDHLKSLMFIVASDLSDTQRKRLTIHLSLLRMDVPAYTFEAVRTTFQELFFRPKILLSAWAGRASRCSDPLSRFCSLHRTFIVEDGSEEESGQWATDEIIGEEGFVDDENLCIWTWNENRSTWKYRPFQSRQLKKRPEKGKEEAHLQSGHSSLGASEEEGHDHSWEFDDWNSGDWYCNCCNDSCSTLPTTGYTAMWMASVPLNLTNHPTHVALDLDCTRSVGSRSTIGRFQKHTLHYDIITELCACNKSFVFANSEMETCWESCTMHFPTKPPWSTNIDVLETSVRILFSLPQMTNWRMTIELNPKGDKNCMSTFWSVLFSRWVRYYGTYRLGFDESHVWAKIAWAIHSLAEICLDRSKNCAPSSFTSDDEDD